MCYVQVPGPQMAPDLNSGNGDAQQVQQTPAYFLVQAPMSPCGMPQNMLPLQTVQQPQIQQGGTGFAFNMMNCGDGNFNGQAMPPANMGGSNGSNFGQPCAAGGA